MYSTCTFCHAPLGANEALERFPVGRCIAFDSARGRLWAVCGVCAQWNLSPIETRWEAIEEGEKLYRDSRRRVATDQIGLAKTADGTELIRIGEPLRPEFAAWRYGARFSARWRRNALFTAGVVTAVGGLFIAGPMMGVIATGGWFLPYQVAKAVRSQMLRRTVIARGRDENGPIVVMRPHAKHARLIWAPEDSLGWQLQVPRLVGTPSRMGWYGLAQPGDPTSVLAGTAALEMARSVFAEVNRSGGRARAVEDAVRSIEEHGSPETLLRDVALRSVDSDASSWLGAQPVETRLALEMAANEETERRALQGELQALEARWKDAEEIAAIADTLTLPQQIVQRLDRMR